MPVKYSEFIERLRRSSFFTFRSVEAVVGRDYAKLLIHNLKRRGQIVELLRGVYSFKKSPYMIVKAIPMAYIGLGSAAFLHGAWSQVTAVTVLSPSVSKAARWGIREVAGFKVMLRRISDKMYFGYEYKYLEEIDEWVRVSDPEKTMIDLTYFKYPARDEIIPRLLEMVDTGRLKKYLDKMEVRRVRGHKKIEREINQWLNHAM